MSDLENRLRDVMALRSLPLGPDDRYMTAQILDALHEAVRIGAEIERETCARLVVVHPVDPAASRHETRCALADAIRARGGK